MRRASRLFQLAALVIALPACRDAVGQAPAAPSGRDLYASQGCVICHGAEGAGTSFGPTLLGKKAHWTRETLILYLKNPVEYAASVPRLVEQSQRYTLPMLRFDKLPEEELSALADHVLHLP